MGAFDDIADGVVAAITAGDSTALGELYADDVVVWHNTDGIEMTKDENLASLDALAAMTTAFVQQYPSLRNRWWLRTAARHAPRLGLRVWRPPCLSRDQGRERQNHQGRRVLRWSDHRHIWKVTQ